VTRVLLIRHGQSTWNAVGRWQGCADPPLSARGEAEATIVAEALAAGELAGLERLGAAVSSDLARARVTAEVVSERLGWGPVGVYPGLRERDVGAFSGLTRAEIEARWPGILAHAPLDPPEAESRRAVAARAVATLHRIAAVHPDCDVLAVTHGALIRAVEAHLGVAEPGPPPNLSGRWVSISDGRLTAGERVAVLAAAPTGALT
jgi:probable phosphoglycerate mutase